MTAYELKRYECSETDGGEMIECQAGEYVKFDDARTHTQAAIAEAMMGAVKPLEWWDCPEFSTADGRTISYHCICRLDGLYEVKVGNEGDKSSCIDGTYASLEDAKAAADADWQARILSALSIPPDAMAALEAVKVQVREAIAAWHDSEALRIFDRLGDVAGVYFHRNAAASIRAMKGGE